MPRRWRRSSYGRRKRDRQRPRKNFAAFLYVSPFTASIWYLPIFDVCNQPAKHGSATGFLSNPIATRWNSCSSRHGDAFASSYSPSPGYSSTSPSHVPRCSLCSSGTVDSCVSSLPILSRRRVLLAVTHLEDSPRALVLRSLTAIAYTTRLCSAYLVPLYRGYSCRPFTFLSLGTNRLINPFVETSVLALQRIKPYGILSSSIVFGKSLSRITFE